MYHKSILVLASCVVYAYPVSHDRDLLQVLLARHKEEGGTYAVKVLNKSLVLRKNEAKHIMSERNVLVKNITHPFLVGLHYSFQTSDKLYFVLDYVNGGEVRPASES